ncbi:putative Zn-dependent protease [Roseateles depolymerans]|uniref:TPR repeat-containing protein YfgC n=1 Tax=Roseateles depolymerans TaxID=76731 RepID=A0A0U3MKV8_9BURK|nr:TPR repeat-containing protein YfgC [Roseateles depolymerans]REG13883.1 putative Zn-dependent protease [Roseateles depolymerans]
MKQVNAIGPTARRDAGRHDTGAVCPPASRREPVRPLRRCLAALLGAALLTQSVTPSAWAQVNLPALGDSVSAEVSISAEKKLGDQVMRQIRPDPDYLDDPLLLEYVQGTFSPLVQAARKLGNISDDTSDRFAWEVFLVRDKSVNAFALPGGYIGVHLGLISMTGARDELASVLGHELSHVTQRHIARSYIGESRNSLLATAGMILGILAAARSRSTDGVQAAVLGSQAAAAQASLNFSRDMEREADRVGFQVMTQAGYAPAGMASMFERMEQAYHLMDSGSYPYLRSHPLTSERIGEARARLGTNGETRVVGTTEHALMAARSKVLMDQRAEAWRQLQGLDAGARQGGAPMDQLAARYASALASIKLRDFSRAETTLKTADAIAGMLGADAGAKRMMVYLHAEFELARGKPAAGMAALEALKDERSRPLLMMKAELAKADERPEVKRAVADSLQTWLSLNGNDALGWQEIAPLWQQLDQPLRSVRAQGEARAAMGDIVGAIDRLRSASRLSRGRDSDQIEASVIDARLRTLVYERRQMLAEMYPRGVPPGAEQ